MKQKLFYTASILVLLVSTGKVNAIQPLLAVELASHCKVLPKQTESIDGQFCIRYIQGFIDGSITTDERVLLNHIEPDTKKGETYSQRAARVRGVSLSDPAEHYDGFCLGDPVSLREVVDLIVKDLKTSKLVTEAMASTVVYTSLRKHYPCKLGSNPPR